MKKEIEAQETSSLYEIRKLEWWEQTPEKIGGKKKGD